MPTNIGKQFNQQTRKPLPQLPWSKSAPHADKNLFKPNHWCGKSSVYWSCPLKSLKMGRGCNSLGIWCIRVIGLHFANRKQLNRFLMHTKVKGRGSLCPNLIINLIFRSLAPYSVYPLLHVGWWLLLKFENLLATSETKVWSFRKKMYSNYCKFLWKIPKNGMFFYQQLSCNWPRFYHLSEPYELKCGQQAHNVGWANSITEAQTGGLTNLQNKLCCNRRIRFRRATGRTRGHWIKKASGSKFGRPTCQAVTGSKTVHPKPAETKQAGWQIFEASFVVIIEWGLGQLPSGQPITRSKSLCHKIWPSSLHDCAKHARSQIFLINFEVFIE